MNEERNDEFFRKAEDFKKSMKKIIHSDYGEGKAVILIMVHGDKDDNYLANVSYFGTRYNLSLCVRAMFYKKEIKKMIIEEIKKMIIEKMKEMIIEKMKFMAFRKKIKKS
jgi:hypothetical protein